MPNVVRIHQQRDSSERLPSAPRSPQLEDGYTRIANELFEALYNSNTFPGTLRQMRLVHAVIRMTFGFNKKLDRISDGQLAKETGMPRQKVNEAKHELIAAHVFILSVDGKKIGINKIFQEWDFSAKPDKKLLTSRINQNGDSVTKSVTKNVTKSGSHQRQKESLEPKGSKESSAKPKSSKPKTRFEQVDMDLAERMAGHVDALAGEPGKRNLNAWANDIRLMRERDGHGAEQIQYLIEWVARDSFWRRNVLSPSKLREKWTQLVIQAKTKHEQRASRLAPGRHTNLRAPDTSDLVALEDGTYEF